MIDRTDRQPVELTPPVRQYAVTPFSIRVDGESRLEIDGHDVARQVTGFNINASARAVPVITLDMLVGDLYVDFPDAAVEVAPATHDVLVRLGWTPPATGEETTA